MNKLYLFLLKCWCLVTRKKLEYIYFVSFSYPKGFGNIEIKASQMIDCFEDINKTQNIIEQESAVVLSYQLQRVGVSKNEL